MRLNPIDQNDPDLEGAVLYQAILKTLEYLDEFGAISLTKSGALIASSFIGRRIISTGQNIPEKKCSASTKS